MIRIKWMGLNMLCGAESVRNKKKQWEHWVRIGYTPFAFLKSTSKPVLDRRERVEVDTRVRKQEVKLEWRPSECWKDFRTHQPDDNQDPGKVVCFFVVMRELKCSDYPKMLHDGKGETFLEFARICTWNDLMNKFKESRGEHLDDVRYWTEIPAWPGREP